MQLTGNCKASQSTYIIKQNTGTRLFLAVVLRIRDILVRIRMRILGSVPLNNGSRCGSGGPKTYVSYGSESGSPTMVSSTDNCVSHHEYDVTVLHRKLVLIRGFRLV